MLMVGSLPYGRIGDEDEDAFTCETQHRGHAMVLGEVVDEAMQAAVAGRVDGRPVAATAGAGASRAQRDDWAEDVPNSVGREAIDAQCTVGCGWCDHEFSFAGGEPTAGGLPHK
jgi:hypothetical protein